MTTDRIRVRIHWRDMVTGQEGVYEDPIGHGTCGRDEMGRLDAFIWEDGNYACDCNRGAMFAGIADHPCGSNRFEILSMEPISDERQ